MIKILYANGDSFGFGQDIDTNRQTKNIFELTDYQKQNCYTGVIANKLKCKYINNSSPGGSNQRIYRTMIYDISNLLKDYKNDEIFVMISLTHNNRKEFYNNKYRYYYQYMVNLVPSHLGTQFVNLHNILSKNYYSYEYDCFFDIQMTLGIENFLRINQIPYLLSYSMISNDELKQEIGIIGELIDKQRYTLRLFRQYSFSDYVFNYLKLPRSLSGHPLTCGHLAWANRLSEYIEENELFSNKDLV